MNTLSLFLHLIRLIRRIPALQFLHGALDGVFGVLPGVVGVLVVELLDHPVDVAGYAGQIVLHEFEDGIKECLLFFFRKAGVGSFAEVAEVWDAEAPAGENFLPEGIVFLPEIEEGLDIALFCILDPVADEAGVFLRAGKLSDRIGSGPAGACRRGT